jgi:S-adenosylmethionine:tRNA ribosyltransferase-isomerase
MFNNLLYGKVLYFCANSKTMMKDPRKTKMSEYDYSLPDAKIRKHPLKMRESAKLLIYNNGEIKETVFSRFFDILPPQSMVVLNATRVINARIFFRKDSGAKIEILCLKPVHPFDYELIFKQNQRCVWECFVGNLAKWKEGPLINSILIKGKRTTLTANLLKTEGDVHHIEFAWDNEIYTFARILEIFGSIPIPPYLNRKADADDTEFYQTTYASMPGSVASPTAGLHFDRRSITQFDKRNILHAYLVLHVGAGTFKPVTSETIGGHEMHGEMFFVHDVYIEGFWRCIGHIIAVGTTAARAIESLYYLGVLISQNPNISPEDLVIDQWMPYNPDNNLLSVKESLQTVLAYMKKKQMKLIAAMTHILIVPGYQFKLVSGLFTNFHQPQSTLLLMVDAFVQGNWKRIYNYALEHDFRFLSYGDGSLLLNNSITPSSTDYLRMQL